MTKLIKKDAYPIVLKEIATTIFIFLSTLY